MVVLDTVAVRSDLTIAIRSTKGERGWKDPDTRNDKIRAVSVSSRGEAVCEGARRQSAIEHNRAEARLEPKTAGVAEGVTGLYFLALPFQHTLTSALIGWVGADARYVAEHLRSLER